MTSSDKLVFGQKIVLAAMILTFTAVVTFIAISVDRTVNGPYETDIGGEGQRCYANETCDSPFTCFEVKNRRICERDVKPVVKTGAKHCFTHQDEEGEIKSSCFDSPNECAKGIGAVMQTPIKIIKGCRWEN